MNEAEVTPPWVMYPGFPPADPFWRQSGEIWFHEEWRPFWESLSPEEEKDYLTKWPPPDEWLKFYFDPDFQAWLRSTD